MKLNILVFDEATSMLDPTGRRDINNLINELHRDQNLTVISITHDIEEAYLSDRIILLHEGEIVLSCLPSELFNNREVISKYNLSVPFEVLLKQKCLELGLKVTEKTTIEEIGEMLWQSK